MIHRKHKGARNELAAIVWLLDQGYEVFRNVSAHGSIDVIAVKDGEVTRIDVKGNPALFGTAEQVALKVKFLALFGTEYELYDPQLPPLKQCKVCGKTLPYAGQTCSIACAVAVRDRKVPGVVAFPC
jgi:hypothetical protein